MEGGKRRESPPLLPSHSCEEVMVIEGKPSTVSLLLRDARTFFPTIWLFVAPIVLAPLAIWGGDAGRCAFVILVMSCFWVVEVVPLPVIALLPLVALPLLSVLSVKTVAASYLNDTNIMMMGSMFLALAVEESNLHKRIALRLMTFVGAKPHMLMAGFMIITSFISLWISDTATAALMCPIAMALLESVMAHRQRHYKDTDGDGMHRVESVITGVTIPSDDMARPIDTSLLSQRDRGICKCIMLIVAHASLIGGTGTINSTGPNLIFRSTIQQFYPGENTGVSYFSWMIFAIPPMVLYMFASWFIVQLQFLGFSHIVSIFKKGSEEERKEEEYVKKTVQLTYDNLGPMTWAEKWTLGFFVALVSLWMTSDPKVIPGWVDLFPRNMVTDSCAGILITFLFFAFPRECPDFFFLREDRDRPSIRRSGLLTWEAVRRKFSWSVILLLGAGIAISASVKESGLSRIFVCWLMDRFHGMPHFLIQILLSIIVVVATEFSTNTATGSVFIPIAFSMAEELRVHPLFFSIPAAIGPSFSFMLPMATPPNAIVYETKTMTMWEMASCGILLNIACITITVLNMNSWTWFVFNMGEYPEYAMRHNNTLPCS